MIRLVLPLRIIELPWYDAIGEKFSMKNILLGLVLAVLSLNVTGCSDSDAGLTIKGTASTSSALASVATSGSPTYLLMTVYAAYISTSADCSSPILVEDHGSTGREIDMISQSGPTLFSGNPAAGTYPCIILKIKDTMNFKVDSTAVTDHPECTSTTTEHTFDVYRDGNSDDGLQVDMNGAAVDARGSASSPVADTIYVFASTGAATDIRANGVAINENQYVNLNTALVVPSVRFFYFDMSDGVSTHNEASVDYCWLEGTETSGFGFRD